MSTYTHESMINHHGTGFLTQLVETLHAWRQRYQSRRELAQWSDAGTARHRHLPERHRLRGRKTVLAGLSGSRAGAA